MAASQPQATELTGNGSTAGYSHPGGFLLAQRHDDTGTTGTTVVEFKPDGQDNWQEVPDTTLTASGGHRISIVKSQVRITLSSHSGNSVWAYLSSFA